MKWLKGGKPLLAVYNKPRRFLTNFDFDFVKAVAKFFDFHTANKGQHN